MTNKVYRTHQGRTLDIGALILRNENVRAVGNMAVNAKGDRVDADNRSIDSKPNQVNRQYRKQASKMSRDPAPEGGQYQAEPGAKAKRAAKAAPEVPPPPEDFDDDFVKPAQTVQVEQAQPEPLPEAAVNKRIPQGGLAAAIAQARRVEQKPIESRNPARTKSGVAKI